jgi:hypothetical protein
MAPLVRRSSVMSSGKRSSTIGPSSHKNAARRVAAVCHRPLAHASIAGQGSLALLSLLGGALRVVSTGAARGVHARETKTACRTPPVADSGRSRTALSFKRTA